MNILFNLYVILALRIAHVVGGVLWAGSGILYLFVLLPAVKSTTAAGQTFMQNFGPRFAKWMPIVSTVTVISGALLYARLFVGGIEWIWTTGAGICFTVGALAAVISYVLGAGIITPTQDKIGALGAAMASAGGPPQPEQMAEMNRLQNYAMQIYRADFVLVVMAMVTMAVARYV